MNNNDDISITLHETKTIVTHASSRPKSICNVSAPVVNISGRENPEPVFYFSLKAWATMLGHAVSRLDCEVGGFLLGEPGKDEKGPFFIVRAAIKAAAATERRATVKFTHESWEYLDDQRRRHYPNEKLIGWYHTHPGYGTFFSSYDEFIQKNFFAGPQAFGVVLDSVFKDVGLYQYINKLESRKYWQLFIDGNESIESLGLELIKWLHVEKTKSLEKGLDIDI